MKRAKQNAKKTKLRKPRNPVLVAALQKNAGVHQRRDKRASRARQKALAKKEIARA